MGWSVIPVSFPRWLTTEKATVAGARAVPSEAVQNADGPNGAGLMVRRA